MPKIESYQQGTPSYVELVTPDQRAAGEFYAALFGWQVDEVPLDDEGNVYLTASLQGDTVAGITGQMPELAGHPAFWAVYLTVDDVDSAAGRVAEAGGKVEAGPFDVMDLGRMAAIQDPTGARVNLWQPGSAVGTERANEPGAPTWNELVSPDLPTATRFYEQVLGVRWHSHGMEAGDYLVMLVGDRSVAGSMKATGDGVPPHWNVYLEVPSVDDTVASAERQGGRVVAPAFDVPEVGRMACLADPQGASFWVIQSAS